MKTIHAPENLVVVSSGWLRFNDDYDPDLAEYEGYIYRGTETGRYYVGTYHQDVGLVTYHGPFATERDAAMFLGREWFENYAG